MEDAVTHALILLVDINVFVLRDLNLNLMTKHVKVSMQNEFMQILH